MNLKVLFSLFILLSATSLQADGTNTETLLDDALIVETEKSICEPYIAKPDPKIHFFHRCKQKNSIILTIAASRLENTHEACRRYSYADGKCNQLQHPGGLEMKRLRCRSLKTNIIRTYFVHDGKCPNTQVDVTFDEKN